MKAEELRIGNLVRVFGHKKLDGIQTIKGITDISVCIYSEEFHTLAISLCHPIPLTEEWLVRLGFRIGNNKDISDSFYSIKLSASTLHINPYNGVVWIHTPVGHPFNNPQLIEYVHQLQNLYFALTGTELTLKEGVKK